MDISVITLFRSGSSHRGGFTLDRVAQGLSASAKWKLIEQAEFYSHALFGLIQWFQDSAKSMHKTMA